jgi:hypothetical protein
VAAATRVAATRVATKALFPLARPALSRSAPAVLCSLLAITFLAPASALATNRTLKTTLGKWSHTIALDARAVSLSASQRHPRRMMLRAQEFRADSLKARRAVIAQKPSTAGGRKARQLALAAFADYALVGTHWALSGRARLQGHTVVATRQASAAKRYAVKGNSLIRSAGRLLR